MSTPFVFCAPSSNYFNSGSLSLAIEQISKNHAKILLVCDPFLLSSGVSKKVTDIFENYELEYHIFSELTGNPTWSQVQNGIDVINSFNIDLIVSLGGGSAHDCAKGIAFFSANEGTLKDFSGLDEISKPTLPIVCINTTSGTGAETTRVSIISDEEAHIKRILFNKSILPTISVNDPELMLNMPQSLSAATGVDALTHAIESYLSVMQQPITEALAYRAVGLIFENLKASIDSPDDADIKGKVASASMMAGLATNSGLGCVHALAHQLGGFYHKLPHGLCCAILLPHVLRWLAQSQTERIAELATAIGIYEGDAQSRTNTFIDRIEILMQTIGLTSTLSDLNVDSEHFAVMANNALQDICSMTSAQQPSQQEYISILNQCL